ncbi:MAG TPA: hypothetical protein VKM72_10650 [Thermoanaerobaculia bacterium]|nr:hypothetical protein [Thermoanaerobaculia bacterium]
MRLHRTTTALAGLALMAVLGQGCNASPTEPKEDENVQASVCEAGPYRIHLSGQCRVAGSHRIVCEDETTTTPGEKVLNVVFQLRNAVTGTPMETKSIQPGTIPREASFSGIASGEYEVRHTVQARDCSATFTTYAGLEVF